MSFLDAHFPDVAAKLQRVKATGERTARASCPTAAHRRGDRNPSLLLKLADNGGLIFSCFPGGTPVSGRVTGALKARYAGDIVKLTTDGGRSLAITPNHPVLTGRGFVPAGELREGDDLVCHSVRLEPDRLREHDQHAPAPIEDVFEAFAVLGKGPRAAPIAAFQLDGDESRLDPEVEVVGAYRRLLDEVDPPRRELGGEFLFARPDMSLPRVPGGGGLLVSRRTSGATAAGRVGRTEHSGPLRVARSRPPHGHLLGRGSPPPAIGVEPIENGVLGDASASGESLDRRPGVEFRDQQRHVDGGRFLGRRSAATGMGGAGFAAGGAFGSDPQSLRFGPAAELLPRRCQVLADGGSTDADLPADLRRGHPGSVELDKIVGVEREAFDGHVYDLSTEVGYFAAGGIIVSNCRAGCGKDQVLAALGLRWRDLCHDRPREGRVMSRLVKTYPYRTPDGVTSFEVCRYHPKQGFPPRRKLPQCGTDWVYSIIGGPVRRVEARHEESGFKWVRHDGWKDGDPCPPGCVMTKAAELWPYNADLIAAEPDRLVFWCEGEKDADNLRKLGLLATTTQGGAGVSQKEGAGAWKRPWSKLFRDRVVVVAPDNDPAGYGYAAWAIGCLVMAGAAGVVPLRLKGMRPKGDVSDYLFDNYREEERQGPKSPAARHLRGLVTAARGLTASTAAEMFRNPAAKAARAVDPEAAYRDNGE